VLIIGAQNTKDAFTAPEFCFAAQVSVAALTVDVFMESEPVMLVPETLVSVQFCVMVSTAWSTSEAVENPHAVSTAPAVALPVIVVNVLFVDAHISAPFIGLQAHV
jgi:hypothetical protein